MARQECDTPLVLWMMGVHNYFLEKVVFIFSFVGLGIWDGLHIWGGGKENKMSKKMNVNLFTTKLGWNISCSCQGPKSLEATVLYNDSQHNIPAFLMSHFVETKISCCLNLLMSHFVVTKFSCCLPSWWVIL
jgi:hypothetical protein